MQALGLDGEAEEFGAVFFEGSGQSTAIEVFRDQREICGLEAKLHGQVERGRRLAAAADAIGAPGDLVEEIRAAETARFAAERLAALGLTVDFNRELAKRAIRSLKGQYPGEYHLAVLVCDFEGQFICRVDEGDAL